MRAASAEKRTLGGLTQATYKSPLEGSSWTEQGHSSWAACLLATKEGRAGAPQDAVSPSRGSRVHIVGALEPCGFPSVLG